MIFQGEPNLTVIDRKTRRKLFQFDTDGRFETEDERLIKRIQPHYKAVEQNKRKSGQMRNARASVKE